jgi:hypothetical protein
MKFVVVNGRTPRQQTRCALCCEPIGKSYLRELTTQLSYCVAVMSGNILMRIRGCLNET